MTEQHKNQIAEIEKELIAFKKALAEVPMMPKQSTVGLYWALKELRGARIRLTGW